MAQTDHLINLTKHPEIARQLGIKSGISRRKAKVEVATLRLLVDRLTEQVADLQARKRVEPVSITLQEQTPDERLITLRSQIDAIDARLNIELSKPTCHPKVVSELARAKATLAELERRMAGRPLPPTVRANGRALSPAPTNRPPPTPIA